MRRAFTLVELLVVIGMITILMGAMSSGIGQARRRAKIARATQEITEMTNAIRAYENYAPDRKYPSDSTGEDIPAQKGRLGIILGNAAASGGGNVPVLYNAHVRADGFIVDPWGTPYTFTVKLKTGIIDERNQGDFITAPSIPNFYRLSNEERE